MDIWITHNRNEESLEAKASWFQSLTMSKRAELFCQFTDMILSINPGIVDQMVAKPVKGRVLVLSSDDLAASKRAADRKIEIEDALLQELDDG